MKKNKESVNDSYFEMLLYNTDIAGNIYKINGVKELSLIDDFQFGYCFGGGIEYKLNFKNALFFEIRYKNQNNFGNSESLGISGFNLMTGINF